jgi:hypothetical protein
MNAAPIISEIQPSRLVTPLPSLENLPEGCGGGGRGGAVLLAFQISVHGLVYHETA